MRTMWSILLPLGVTVWVTGSAHSQGFPFAGGRLSGTAILLRHEGVQAELQVTEEQNQKIKEVSQRIRDKHQKDFEKLEKLEDGRERSLAKRNLSKTIIEEVTRELPGILTPGQFK